MVGAFFALLSVSASILVFARLGVFSCIPTSCTLLHPEMGFCLSVLTSGDDFLMPLRSLFRNLNGITSRFCLFLAVILFGLMMRGSPFPGCTGTRRRGNAKSNFKCRWIFDHSDAEVGAFLDSLLGDMEKQSRFDRLMEKMAEVEGMGPRSVLRHARAPAAPVPPTPSSGVAKTRKKPPVASSCKPFSMERGEGVKEDPSADLK
ncbi:hypothetical protein PIB30_083263 [Stylosanthes scabra]|uniref:Uncharacterized protein n=1 Tax=Stylosanthes scabra TaxID=79078 RepID=A0ABU6ZQU0_9FABA|nr:hypothetical protein [Stylosanthes scabra]